jgi:hypothetical protein
MGFSANSVFVFFVYQKSFERPKDCPSPAVLGLTFLVGAGANALCHEPDERGISGRQTC